MDFPRIAVIGVGLIGGSLALAVKKRGLCREIVGIGRSESSLRKALELDVIDTFTLQLEKGVSGADLVVLATPLSVFAGCLKTMCPYLKPGAVVTDVGSAKEMVLRRAQRFPEILFVGAHPIAGTEKSGVTEANADLFDGARCIITPTSTTDPHALDRVEKLWKGVGSRVIRMDAETHDCIMAAVSHLPHMAAYALVNSVAGIRMGEIEALSFTGGGFKDFTRIASSHPIMWRDICLENKKHLLKAVERFEDEIKKLKQHILDENGEALCRDFQLAKTTRDRLTGAD
jgi:prephenate dehydrogenase